MLRYQHVSCFTFLKFGHNVTDRFPVCPRSNSSLVCEVINSQYFSFVNCRELELTQGISGDHSDELEI